MIQVLFKEILDNFRDRRVVISTLIISPLLGPLLFGGMMTFMSKQVTERMESVLELPVVGRENAPNLVGWLERQGVVIKAPPADPEQAIRDETEEVVLRIPADFGEHWTTGRPAPVEIIADRSLRYTGTTISRVQRYLTGYSQTIGQIRLMMRGVDPQLMRPIDTQVVDLSTPTSRGGEILAFLPYFILLTLFAASMHMAIDTTAGERERKSLEPLLINPVPRWQIMTGKLLATSFFALASLALSLVAFVYAMKMLPTAMMDVKLNLDFAVAARAFIIVAPAALLAAAMLIILASFAKSFREAQSYVGMIILVPMIPSLWLMVDPTKAEYWMTWVPLLNQNIMITELVRGNAPDLLWYITSIGATLVVSLLLGLVAAGLYNRPKLIFTGG
ncbi:MAG: ABC transporter permease [Wenzhouxiangellaceae bacterium]|nr:ABC transporter permease [Wenzhouxiangellaceae bacterium]